MLLGVKQFQCFVLAKCLKRILHELILLNELGKRDKMRGSL